MMEALLGILVEDLREIISQYTFSVIMRSSSCVSALRSMGFHLAHSQYVEKIISLLVCSNGI